MTDPYESVTCPKCGREWQRIDWNCALHQMSCGAQDQPKVSLRKYDEETEKYIAERERKYREYMEDQARKMED